MKSYDAVIIGFGKAGKTLAVTLGDHGWRVALIEQSTRMYGGTCINIACIPTKTLLHEATARTPYSEAIARKDDVTATLRGRNRSAIESRNTVDLYTGRARFLNDHEVRISSDSESLTIRGETIFINTGAEPFIPTIEGLTGIRRVYTSTSLMEVETLPPRLAIIGSGSIGLEFAATYAAFGSQVTVFARSDRLLNREDSDITVAVQSAMEQNGISFVFNAEVTKVEDVADKPVVITYRTPENDRRTIETDAVLVATGRRPVTRDLDLEAAGVATDERGYVTVDDHLRTTVPHIWALGDVNGGPQFTYISLDDYRIAMDALVGDGTRSRRDRRHVPYAYFLNPTLARAGMTETQARADGFDIAAATLSVNAIPRAHVGNDTRGLLKAVVDRETRRILGAAFFCANAEELINVVGLAMSLEQDFTVLRDRIYTHPSMTEALNDLFGMIQVSR